MSQKGTDPSLMSYMDHCRKRIQDAVDDMEDDRIFEEEEAMAREASEIPILNDGDLVEDDEVEGDDYALQILLNMRAYGEV